MRKFALNDIELAYQKVMLEAKEEERLCLTNLYAVYICSAYSSNGTTYDLSASSFPKGDPKEKDDFIHGDQIIVLKIKTFTRLINELITSIQKGELDDQTHLTGNHIIYNKIYKASLQKTEPSMPLVIGVPVQIPEGELVQYVCPHCHNKVTAPYSSTNQSLLCLNCTKYFDSNKTSFTRA